MKHFNTDIKFLDEFSQFSCKCSLTVAKSLHSSYFEHIKNKEYDSAAHCLIKLNSEMIMTFELFSALLYSFSKWDHKGGILKKMMKYSPEKARTFVEKLVESNDPLKQVCFPTKEDFIRESSPKKQKDYSEYNPESFIKDIRQFVRMLNNQSILDSYHKVKHGSMIIRDPSCVLPIMPLPIDNRNHIYIVRETEVKIDHKTKKIIDPLKFAVLGSKAKKLADGFLHNIKATTNIASKSAVAVAFYLEKDIMQESSIK